MPVTGLTCTLRDGPAPKQFAALRVPSGKGPFPVAVLIHGGRDVSFGSSGTIAPIADALTKRGIATINVQYRVVGDPGGGWSGTMRDVGTAIDAVRLFSRVYPLDLHRLVIAGHSAGARLALWSAMRDTLSPHGEVALPNPLLPTAVVAIDGPGALRSVWVWSSPSRALSSGLGERVGNLVNTSRCGRFKVLR